MVGVPARWRLAALTYGGTQLILLGWWLAFYPGVMSYDSVAYVWQVSTSNWTSNHSVLYNALVWLSLQATGQLGLLSLAQTVAAAVGLAYAVTGLRRLRVPGRWLAAAALLVVCVPAVGTFVVYISKDVAFVITQIWALGTVARIVADRPALAAQRRRAWGLLGALAGELALLGLFRQNGFLVIAVTALLAVAALRGLRWRITAAGASAIVVTLLANGALYPALGVRSPGPDLLFGTAWADIAVAYAKRPGTFTAADRAAMSTVAPLDFWAASANCYSSDATILGKREFNLQAARDHSSELFDVWLRVLRRTPEELVQARICRGSIAWNPFPGPARGWTVKPPVAGASVAYDFPRRRLAESPFAGAIRSAPPIPLLHDAAVWLRHLSDTRSFQWLLWRGATWCYIAYLAVLLWGRRRRELGALALVAAIVANQVTVLASNPNQLVRYMMGPFVLGVLLLPLAFVPHAMLARDGPAGDRPLAGGGSATDEPPPQERSRSEDSEPRHSAELTVARVTEAGHDEGAVVEPLVDGGGD